MTEFPIIILHYMANIMQRGMDMDTLDRYPGLKEKIEILCRTRRDEILAHMVEADSEYDRLNRERADASMALKNAIDGTDADALFETYSDAVYAQEVYELDAVYKQATIVDTLETLKTQGLL
jgi:hypothetical protein